MFIPSSTADGEYVDAGAWCSDFHEGDITGELVVRGATVSITTASQSPHYVNYECTTVDGSATTTARRTVYVVPPTPAPPGRYLNFHKLPTPGHTPDRAPAPAPAPGLAPAPAPAPAV